MSRRDEVFEVLSHVPDPEIPCVSVVDLGIVRDVTDDTLTITPTYTYNSVNNPMTPTAGREMFFSLKDNVRWDRPAYYINALND